jgi:hypothetical protein
MAANSSHYRDCRSRCFPDEASEYADGGLVAFKWSVEVTNAVLMAMEGKNPGE